MEIMPKNYDQFGVIPALQLPGCANIKNIFIFSVRYFNITIKYLPLRSCYLSLLIKTAE